MNLSVPLTKGFFFFLPPLFFFISYRLPVYFLIPAIIVFIFGLAIAVNASDSIARDDKIYSVVVAVTCFSYGLFKAFSFSEFQTQLQTFLYYSAFVGSFFLVISCGLFSKYRPHILYGFVFAGVCFQLAYFMGFLDWNQYQIVGNTTFLSALAAYILRRYLLTTFLCVLVFNTPSSQSQVLLIFFCCYLLYVYSSRFVGFQRYIIVAALFFVSVPTVLFLFSNVGDYLLFSELSNSRQFNFLDRVSDRSLILYDHIRLIHPYLPLSQAEVNTQSAYGFSSESKVHGIWLANWVYMGFILGSVNLIMFLAAAVKYLRFSILLIAISLTPWLVSSEVNPIKFAVCALALARVLIDRPREHLIVSRVRQQVN